MGWEEDLTDTGDEMHSFEATFPSNAATDRIICVCVFFSHLFESDCFSSFDIIQHHPKDENCRNQNEITTGKLA